MQVMMGSHVLVMTSQVVVSIPSGKCLNPNTQSKVRLTLYSEYLSMACVLEMLILCSISPYGGQ